MGDCRPMSARITERQCGINRARELFSCKHCFGLENITETAIEGEIVSKKGKCVKCKRPDMAIVAAGLCGKCYLDRKKEIEAAAASGSDANETPPAGNEEIISTPADHIVSVATETTAGSNPRSLLSMITPPPNSKIRRNLSRFQRPSRPLGGLGGDQRQRTRRHLSAVLDAGAGKTARGGGMIGPSPRLNQLYTSDSPCCPRLPLNQGADQSSYWMCTGRLF
jgi:hypothetical protein